MPLCGVCPSVCLSVCSSVSVTFVHSVKTSTHYLQFFSPSGSQTILVFSIPNVVAIFRRGPANVGVECRWGRHKSRFYTNTWLSIDDCCTARSTIIDSYRCSSVSQLGLRFIRLFTAQRPRRISEYADREEKNRIYLYAAVYLKRK